MAKPPEDVPADELWLKLNEPRPSEVFDFPRKDADGKPIGQVRVMVLRQESHGIAKIMGQAALHKEAKRYGIENLGKEDIDSPAIQSALSDLIAQELLAMALHSVKPMAGSPDESDEGVRYSRLFHSAEDIRKKLSAAETAVLFNCFLLTQDKYGPFERVLDEGDVDAWIKRLVEGGSKFPLAVLPWLQLGELTYSLAERISSLSRVLESQLSSLPDTLASSLKPFCLDMSSAGKPLAGSTPISWESSADGTARAAEMARETMDRESRES